MVSAKHSCNVVFWVVTLVAASRGTVQGEAALPKEVDWRGKGVLPDVIKERVVCVQKPVILTVPNTAKTPVAMHPVAKIDGGEPVPTGDERALAEAVARQPVMAAIDVTRSFETYRSGVFEDPLCSNLNIHLNHLVLVAGYGTDENGVDYWIVQNTWGEDWEMQGFIYIARNRNNMCGIATDAGYPV